MTTTQFADRIDAQNKLFAELSRMFAAEVPLYDRSLLVNRLCNRAVGDLLARLHVGFEVSDEQIELTSRERHGAIRIGRDDEYRWIARYFAVFAMEPHGYYDMTSVGARSQPIIATAFRSVVNPEHRVFTSLLQLNYFDDATAKRIAAVLARRQVFSPRAKELIEKFEAQGGLDWADTDALIREGTQRIFKWTARGYDHGLYQELCDAGFKLPADIACFETHHLNHLTPNTFCMDLYTTAMKWRLGEMDDADWHKRARRALAQLAGRADRDYLRLHFRHLTWDAIESFRPGRVGDDDIDRILDALTQQLRRPELDLTRLPHSGFKDFTEGPSADTPVLLRQDAYRALTEAVVFTNPDGSTVEAVHTARFGEIEERFYATTPAGRALYDECLAKAEAVRENNPGLIKTDPDAYEAAYAEAFAPFPKTLPELLEAGLVYGRYEPSPKGLATAGSIDTTDLHELRRRGLVRVEGLRYEDFLPISAAGIVASNLNQYGTRSTATHRTATTREQFEAIIGKPITDPDTTCRALSARSILETYEQLGLLSQLDQATRQQLETDAGRLPVGKDARDRSARTAWAVPTA